MDSCSGTATDGSRRLTSQTYINGLGFQGSDCELLGLGEMGMVLLRYCGELGIDGDSMEIEGCAIDSVRVMFTVLGVSQ